MKNFPARLLSGYGSFLGGRFGQERERYYRLARGGQSPKIMVIGCCDSRVSPEVIFDARPGELFVVRNIGNLVPPYTPDGAQRAVSAALEFAVQALKVKHIVVLGHAQCGGIRAYVEEAAPLSPGDFIGHWMALIAPAAAEVGPRGDRTLGQYLTQLEQASIVKMLDNLMTFPWIENQVGRGHLTLHAAYFGVATGQLSVRDPATGQFVQIAADDHRRLFVQPRF